MEQLIFNVLACCHCKESFYGKEAFEEHRCYILHQVAPTHEFGLLHVEMNACKAFIDMNWNIFVSEIAQCLSFRNLKALDYIRKCSDHHKTMKLCEIMYVAMTNELLVPYVRHCMLNHAAATVEGYWEWASDAQNAIYIYIQQMTLTFLHGIIVMCTGARKKTILLQCRTLSQTGNIGHYQGGDAMLEEINKEAKSWESLLRVPTDQEWQKASRNFDKLNDLRKIPTNFIYLLKHSKCIAAFSHLNYAIQNVFNKRLCLIKNVLTLSTKHKLHQT